MAYESVRRGSDEQRYKYLHGGRYGDRDLYDIREQKYGVDDHYRRGDAAHNYRPGFRNQIDDYERGNVYGTRGGGGVAGAPLGVDTYDHPGRGRDVYGHRGVGGAGGYDTGYPTVVGPERVGYGGLGENVGTDSDGVTYGGRHPVPPGIRGSGTGGHNLARDRDGIMTYGPHSSPAGGIKGIDFGHDLANVPPTYHTRKNYPYHERHGAIPGSAGTTATVVHHHPHHHYPHHHHAATRDVYYEEPTYSRTTTYTTSPVTTSTRVISGPTTVTKGVGSYSPTSPVGVRRSKKTGRKKWTPLTDMGETDKYWVVRCEIPGVRKDKLYVEVEGKDLVIRGKRMKELWNSDRFGGGTSSSSGSPAVSNSPAVVPVVASGSAIPSGHTTTTTTSSGTPSGSTTTTSSHSTTVIKSDESGTISRDQKATVTNASGVTHGSESHQFRNPDGTMSNNRIAWVDKERGGHGVFKRKVRLPVRVDISAITAMYSDGVLEVLVRKPDNVEKRKGDRVTIS